MPSKKDVFLGFIDVFGFIAVSIFVIAYLAVYLVLLPIWGLPHFVLRVCGRKGFLKKMTFWSYVDLCEKETDQMIFDFNIFNAFKPASA